MKKLLALILTLLICFSFASCDDSEESSSSETSSSEETETPSSNKSNLYQNGNEFSLESKMLYDYYKQPTAFLVIDTKKETSGFKIIETYEEYEVLCAHPILITLDSSFFEENILLTVWYENKLRWAPVGYRDFYVENGIAYISAEFFHPRVDVESGPTDPAVDYIAIPKELMSSEINDLIVQRSDYRLRGGKPYYMDETMELENGSAFVVNSLSELGISSPQWTNWEREMRTYYDNAFYVAIYRSDIIDGEQVLGYSFEESGDKIIVNSHSTIKKNRQTSAKARFDIVVIVPEEAHNSYEKLSEAEFEIIINKSYVN